ncbi:YesK family protein [Sediminibacillus halophilus]|uniref:YesK-like protein n=1 Tax=Sediminibacillus halophilus TaxID=482461 RepID=A0A1G9T359_9BACI|nr:YesK family protein [Sediminibacillus halophilus]SDM42058.1 YesK-like protein [Sediminibacillus halophilus]
MYLILAYGLFLGLLVFGFFFILSKFKKQFYLAPLLTFITALIIVLYSFYIVRGFEGMGYVFLAIGVFLISVLGTMAMPLLTKSSKLTKVTIWDKIGLVVLPVIFFTTIFVVNGKDDDYWIIDEGHTAVNDNTYSHYRVSTISEGNKQIYLILGEEYIGKKMEVQEVNQNESTEVVLDVVEDESNPNKSPFIYIGLDEIKEPLTVRTMEGEEIQSALEIINE